MPPAPSFVSVRPDSHFSLRNIPFGIISTEAQPRPRPATAIGDYALDLQALSHASLFADVVGFDASVFDQENLNAFAALRLPVRRAIREHIQALLSTGSALDGDHALRLKALIPLKDVKSHLPFQIRDYTDFYASKEHATNVGRLFRSNGAALMPNWLHIPIGYHGRASSVVPSGTSIRRPLGQVLLNPMAEVKQPVFRPSAKLDIELEMAAFVSAPNELGKRVPIDKAREHIFGIVVMNDWSSRDIQAWEYMPLGPFNGKNFGTTISPWVVTLDALEPFKAPLPERAEGIEQLSYLQEKDHKPTWDIQLEVQYTPAGSTASTTISKSNMRHLYYSFAQMLAHHSSGGCPLNTGDLLGSGTISGPSRSELGSLLELSLNGKEPFELDLDDGTKVRRTFLEDGDKIDLVACTDDGSGEGLVGFGHCEGVILQAYEE